VGELTGVEEFNADETFRVDQRLRRLHDLGFDASELELVTAVDGTRLRLVPRVVEHGFHAQKLRTLTGIDAGENQARRLLQRHRPLPHHPGAARRAQGGGGRRRSALAGRTLRADARRDSRRDVGKLEPAELYHQVLEHRWFLSERAGGDVGMDETIASYVRNVLEPARARADHAAAVTPEMARPDDTDPATGD
jgi:hypothetical protein